jgi:GTP-dependent dephospho-CoA kinase
MNSKSYVISEELRKRLKEPLGELLPDKKATKAAILSRLHGSKKDPSDIVVSIGDRTTRKMHEFSIQANLEIIDGKERRNPVEKFPYEGNASRYLKAINQPGGISSDLLSALRKSLDLISKKSELPVRIEVEGEEDLAALPVMAFFPPETTVLYGQPGLGLVIARAKGKSRIESWDILSELGIFSLSTN